MSRRPVIAVIPARGGSKRLPGKNLMPFHGLPLIGWTIRAAQMSKHVDRLILSSDDDNIMEVAEELGCEVPFRRPAALASDTATTAEVVLHMVEALSLPPVTIVILQPTSPLRQTSDIDAACELFDARSASACISVTELPKPQDFYVGLTADGALEKTQVFSTMAPTRPVLITGAIYIVGSETLTATRHIHNRGTVAYPMPYERSVDIDTREEFALAEALWPLSGWAQVGSPAGARDRPLPPAAFGG